MGRVQVAGVGQLHGGQSEVGRDPARSTGATWHRDLPTAVSFFLDDFDACFAHLKLPLAHRNAMQCAPRTCSSGCSAKSVGESWRGVKVTEFETRQLQALREDLQRAHSERVRPVVRVSTEIRPARVSSKSRT
jgi:putative transposase